MLASTLLYVGLTITIVALLLVVKPVRRLRVPTRRRAASISAVGIAVVAVALLLPASESRAHAVTSRLDEAVPVWQFREFHTANIAAPPAAVFDAIKRVRPDEVRLLSTLVRIRNLCAPLPASVAHASAVHESLVDIATSSTFVYLADEAPRELVVGTVVGWPDGARPAVTPALFRTTLPPGYAVAAMNFTVAPNATGGSIVSTETRVFASSAAARRRFAAYWRVIYPGSALIRRMWLRAIDQRATAAVTTIAFTHVNVVDGTSAVPRTDRTVIIAGGRIVTEAPAATTVVPRAAQVIDGRGRYLIPGLWDMHVHMDIPRGDEVLPLYLANGVTGVRDMAGDWARLSGWRSEIAAGRRIGPRMILSGPYLEGGDVPIPHLLVRDTADAQPAVDSLLRLGVDFVKVHTQLDRPRYFAIARAARARRVPFAGHVPRTVLPTEASDSGQRSLEHLLAIPNQCTQEEIAALTPRFRVQAALGGCVTEDLAPMFATFVRNDTYIVPTLVATFDIATWPNRSLPGDSFARYLPPEFRKFVEEIFPMTDDVPPGADVVGRALFDKRVDIVGAMHRAGVRIMSGTDAPLRNSPPGFGLHEELALFVRAGMSPLDALRTATIEPARFLGMLDSLGTVEAGKLADLVLLDANPLADIANTRRVLAVVANGRLFDVRRSTNQVTLEPRN